MMVIAVVLVVLAGLLFIIYALTTAYEKDSQSTENRVNTLQDDKYSPGMGRFAAGREAKASTARKGVADAINQEAASVSGMYTEQTRAKEAKNYYEDTDERAQQARELARKNHEVAMAIAENSRQVVMMASQAGLSPMAYENMIQQNMNLVAQLVAQMLPQRLEQETYRQKAGVDFEFEQLRANLAKHMAKVKMMPHLLQLNELHKQFSGLFADIENAERLPDTERKQAELARLRTKEEYFRDQINQLQTRTTRQRNDFRFDDDENV